MQPKRRELILLGGGALAAQFLQIRLASAKNQSALIAFSGEIQHLSSLSDDAIITGMQLALEDLRLAQNKNSLSWELITLNDNSIPARGVANLRALAKKENLVGIFGGKYSPVVLEMSRDAKNLKIPIFAPWSAADTITADPEMTPYTFRLSMRDTWAISAIVDRAVQRNFSNLGLLVPNSGWGRSCLAAAEKKISIIPKAKKPSLEIQWFQWSGADTLLPQYKNMIQMGVNCLMLVANEPEAALLAYEIEKSKLPSLPIISHWGLTGGDTVKLSEDAVLRLNLEFVQTFNFSRTSSTASRLIGQRAAKILNGQRAAKILNIENINAFPAQNGMAHAYDLMMMIGSAISNIDKISGEAVARAVKNIKQHRGIVKTYIRPFSGKTQDALDQNDIFFCRYASNGEIRPSN